MKERTEWINNLRTAITILVVAHHASLSYTTFAKFDSTRYINSTHPIVDTQRSLALDIFENFNDIFFMSLMFLIGGFFLNQSFIKKGFYDFLKDRFYRLAIPFIFSTFFMWIAYFPPYIVATNSYDFISHIFDFFSQQDWPSGPPWFIWVLFVFNFIFALTYKFFPFLPSSYNSIGYPLNNKRILFSLFIFFLLIYISFVPLAMSVGIGTWIGYGPLDFQLPRILQYFLFFALGIYLGKIDFNNNLFSINSFLVKNSFIWLAVSIFFYSLLTLNDYFGFLRSLVLNNILPELIAWLVYFSIYLLSCLFSCLTFLTITKKYFNSSNQFIEFLNNNAYLLYLIHFVFLIWFQFLFTFFSLHPIIKFFFVFIFSLLASNLLSVYLRKIKIIRIYL
ncbi:MAG: acyltransferase [Chloroherpetonaceae bacterium]|nr:acyltransferase [Chloroherpetonaceae bacterium]